MKTKFKLTTFVAISLTALFVFAPVVSARYSTGLYPPQPKVKGEETSTPSASTKESGEKDSDKQAIRDKLKNRLSEVKLKVCERHEGNIKKRSGKLTERAEKILKKFGEIVQRVDNFYVEKLVPQGGEIENYDQLMSNVDEKSRAVAAALGVAKNTAEGFDCSGPNPKEQLRQFRSDMQGVIRSLHDYKKSVIDYLVAVRTKAKNIKGTPSATSSANQGE